MVKIFLWVKISNISPVASCYFWSLHWAGMSQLKSRPWPLWTLPHVSCTGYGCWLEIVSLLCHKRSVAPWPCHFLQLWHHLIVKTHLATCPLWQTDPSSLTSAFKAELFLFPLTYSAQFHTALEVSCFAFLCTRICEKRSISVVFYGRIFSPTNLEAMSISFRFLN